MRIYITLSCLLLCLCTAGQVLTGKITSEDKQPLPGAVIVADDTLGVNSDSSGHYTLKLSPGQHSIGFRMISFDTQKRLVNINMGETQELNIVLSANSELLNTVVVSAGKFEQRLEDVTVSMEVLKPQLVEKRNATAMDEAVDYIPGVSVVDGQANIRGGSGWSYGAGSRVQLLVDDLPQLTADANDTKWSFLPTENLGQIEVIKGASSVLFGSSALNGVINIRSAYPTDSPSTKINFFAGYYDKATITTDKKYSLDYNNGIPSTVRGLDFFHSRKIGRLDLTFGGNLFLDEGYRKGEDENRGRINVNTRYNFKTPGLSAGINFNTMITQEDVFFIWKNDTSGAYLPAANTLSATTTYRTSIDPYITYVTAKGSSHKLRTRWFNSTNEDNTGQNSTADLFYFEYQYQKHFSDALTVTGGLVEIHSKVRSLLYLDHDGDQDAGYVQGDFKWKRFTFSGGARAEQSVTDTLTDKWTPVFRSGINYHAFGATYFRASAGQGYRFPSIAERFISTTAAGLRIFPNAELKPEKGFSIEAGLKQGFSFGKIKGYFDAAIFQNDYKNMMEFVFAQWGTTQNLINDLGFKSLNVGDTRITGFEITMVGQGKIFPGLDLNVQAGYTYIDPKQLTYDSAYVKKVGVANYMGSDSSDFLKYRFRHLFKGDVELTYKRISLGSSIRYSSFMKNIDKIFVNGFIDLPYPPGLGIADYRKYHTGGDLIVDGRASYKLTKTLHCAFIIKNVFNHIYMQRPADMQPPRTFIVQIGAEF